MELVLQSPGKGNQITYEIQNIGLFSFGGKHLRRYIEEASQVLNGRVGYLVFDKDDELALHQTYHLLVDTEHVSAKEMARMVTDSTCNNSIHSHRPHIRAHADYFYIPPRRSVFKGFREGKQKYPFAICINPPAR